MVNTLKGKPTYTLHRDLIGAPVAAESAPVVSAAFINCENWKTVAGYVKLAGGTAPTVTLKFYERARVPDLSPATEVRDTGLSTAALSDGESFSFSAGGGHFMAMASTITGAPTGVQVMLVGEEPL